MNELDDWFNNEVPSLEAINFQINPKMPGLIEAELVKIYEYIAQWDNDYLTGDSGVKNTTIARKKYQDVGEWATKNIESNLKKIIKDGTGLNLDTIVWNTSVGYFSLITVSDIPTDAMRSVVNGFNGNNLENPSDRIKLAQSLSNSLNKEHGRTDDKYKVFKYALNISLVSMCVRDYISVSDAKENQLSPKEITAILLHEIGHAMSFIEIVGDMMYRGRYGNSILSNLPTVASNNHADLIKEIKTLTTIISENTNDNRIKYLLKRFGKLTLPSRINDTPLLGYCYGFFLAVSVAVLWFCFFLTPLMALISLTDLYSGVALISTGERLFQNSGVTVTEKNTTLAERLADEYVSRYGMSKELNTGLMKIGVTCSKLKITQLGFLNFHRNVRNNVLVGIMSNLLMPVVTCQNLFMDPNGFKTYEADNQRFRRNINNMHDNLNRYDIPLENRKLLAKEIDRMETDYASWIKRTKPFFMFNVNTLFIAFMRDPMETIIADAGLMRQMTTILNNIDRILSNKSGYYKTKFDELA